jgi:hypothetical protein
MKILSYLFFLIYSVGFPAYLYYTLYSIHEDNVEEDPANRRKYGYYYFKYKKQYYYWEFVIIARKLAAALIIQFTLSPAWLMVQTSWLCLLFLFFLFLQMWRQPYEEPLLNELETMGIAHQSFLCFCAIVYLHTRAESTGVCAELQEEQYCRAESKCEWDSEKNQCALARDDTFSYSIIAVMVLIFLKFFREVIKELITNLEGFLGDKFDRAEQILLKIWQEQRTRLWVELNGIFLSPWTSKFSADTDPANNGNSNIVIESSSSAAPPLQPPALRNPQIYVCSKCHAKKQGLL